MQTFEFRSLVAFSKVPANLVRRWIDAEIIKPAVRAEGTGTRRLFSVREAVLVRICDRLYRLGLGEAELRTVADIVDASWSTWRPAALKQTGSTLLWIAITPRAADRHDARLSALAGKSAPGEWQKAPKVALVTPADVSQDIASGVFGIVVPLGDIIAEMEEATGTPLE